MIHRIRSRFISTSVIILCIIFTAISHASIGVQPLIIDLIPKPGETVPFEFKLTSIEKTPEQVTFSIAQPVQQPDGSLVFRKADPGEFPEIQWISIEKTNVMLQPNEDFTMKGRVKVPFNTRGSHLIAVMVEPQKNQGRQSMVLNVRYAVLLSIRISSPGIRTTAQVNAFDIGKDPTGSPRIFLRARNTSLLEFTTSATATVRDKTSKRLIENIELRPKTGWTNQKKEAKILPGSTLEYYGAITKELMPGEYELRLIYRYASSGQILLFKNVRINPGDFRFSRDGVKRRLWVTPVKICWEGRPGTSVMKGMKFENKFEQPVKVALEVLDIEANYPYSIPKNVGLEFKPGKEFMLDRGRMTNIVISSRFPKDALVQGNYGMLRVRVFAADNSSDILEESMLPLESIVTGKQSKMAEATGITVTPAGSKLSLAVVIRNKGNIRVTPRAEVLVKDTAGNLMNTLRLTVGEQELYGVLPGKTLVVRGPMDKVKPGTYQAEVRIYQDTTELGISRLNLVIK